MGNRKCYRRPKQTICTTCQRLVVRIGETCTNCGERLHHARGIMHRSTSQSVKAIGPGKHTELCPEARFETRPTSKPRSPFQTRKPKPAMNDSPMISTETSHKDQSVRATIHVRSIVRGRWRFYLLIDGKAPSELATIPSEPMLIDPTVGHNRMRVQDAFNAFVERLMGEGWQQRGLAAGQRWYAMRLEKPRE